MLTTAITQHPLFNTVKLGVKSLMLHKLRSGLTMLGMIFGVCSVIAMLAIGEGASHEAQERIKRLGSTNIIINSVKPPEEQNNNSSGRNIGIEYGLTYDDASRLQFTIPNVERVLPMRIIRENVRFDRNQVPCQVIGTLPSYSTMQGINLVAGRFLSMIDEKHQRNVCVITASLAQRLFPYQSPLESILLVVHRLRDRSSGWPQPSKGYQRYAESVNR